MQYETETHKITQINTNKSTHSEMAQCDKTQSRELLTAHLSVRLCTASVHNRTQNSSDNLPSYLQRNIIAQDVYRRRRTQKHMQTHHS